MGANNNIICLINIINIMCYHAFLRIIRSKIKNGRSDIVFTHQRTFLPMNCIPNFIAITIPEETRYSSRQQTY